MKKLIFKTIFSTLGVTLVLLVAVFGITSLWAPHAMMKLTAACGLDTISADYAYHEYERSGDVTCLARSFLISADNRQDAIAESRFELLYEREDFDSFCEEQGSVEVSATISFSFRSYLCGQAACVKYRLAGVDEKEGVCDFAISETEQSFPAGNPVVMLAAEAAGQKDAAVCELLLQKIQAQSFEQNVEYTAIVDLLNGVS